MVVIAAAQGFRLASSIAPSICRMASSCSGVNLANNPRATASAFAFETLCYTRLQPLASDNQTNWLTEFAPQLLLYRTLLELTPFLKNDARIPVWQQMYDRAAAMINGEDLAKILDRAAVRKEA